MGVAPPELGQLDGWESSGEEERERWGWCRRSRRSSGKGRAAPKDGDDATAPTGCCIRLWPMGNCPPPPRSTSTSSASTHGGTFAPSPVVACAYNCFHAGIYAVVEDEICLWEQLNCRYQ
jgi:hypothetical protein